MKAYLEEDNSTSMRTSRTAIINSLNDKVPVSMMKQGPPISTTNMVQTLNTGDQGEQREDEEMKNEVTQDEILAMVQQFRKGKGKGKGKGKKGVCWSCGESDHYSRDCPNDKQDSSCTDGGAWKNQKGNKAGNDAGKGWDKARAIGTAVEPVTTKAKTGKGVVSPKNGKGRTHRTIGAHQRGRQEQHKMQQQRQHIQR